MNSKAAVYARTVQAEEDAIRHYSERDRKRRDGREFA
tara:strand:- start:369 stop:479 length:111 start_codon:yes stop_codon:yes gene_type:complete